MNLSDGEPRKRSPLMSPGRISAIVLAAQVAERFFGLVLAAAAANYLGAGRQLDIALLALVVPMAVGNVLEAVSYVSLIPFFSRAQAAEGVGGEWQLANRIINTGMLVSAGIMVLYLSALPWSARILARGYSAAELKQMLALGLLAAPTIALRGTGGTLAALLMSRGAAWPALGRLGARGLARVCFFLLLLYTVTSGATAFVGAAIAADVVAVMFCLPAARRIKGARPYQLGVFARMGVLRAILSQASNQSLTSIFTALVTISERTIAGGLAAGSVAVLNYSRGLGLMPLMVGRSVGGGLYPRLAREAAAGDPALGETAWRGLRAALFVSVPVSVLLYVVREPLVSLFYQRGQFTGRDVRLVAGVMSFYIAACVFRAVFVLVSRSLYSAMRAATVARCEAVAVVTYLVSALLLGPRFGVFGIGAAFTARSVVSAVLLLGAMWRHRLIAPAGPWRYAMHIAWAAALTGFAAWAGHALARDVVASSSALGNAIRVLGGILAGVIGFMPFALTAGRPELNHLVGVLARRPARARNEAAPGP